MKLLSRQRGKLLLVTLIVGVGSGLLGMSLALLLHYVQHIAYGYSPLQIISNESFLEGVSASSPIRRVLVLFICGLIAGTGWWIIYRFGKPLVSIANAIKTGRVMPFISTTGHAILQIVTIALGSPLGREVAPREVSALFSSWISRVLGLNPMECKILLACGAGAGLAAVYNVPLGGAVFVLEVLLCTFNRSILMMTFTTSAIAVLVSWWGLGNEAIYTIPEFELNASLIIGSIVASPFIGFFAFWFSHIANIQRTRAIRNWKMIPFCIINFSLIGLLAIYFPELLGNGKSPAQMEFSNSLSIGVSALVFVIRNVIVWTSLRVGTQGGLLTPSLANGALLGVVLGGIWNLFLPPASLTGFAIIGACAFLASAQKMPLTAIVLILEFTRINYVFLIPILLGVAGSVLCYQITQKVFLRTA